MSVLQGEVEEEQPSPGQDHITKPTAMAQGRVAHLIEWKGWGGGGVGGVGGAGGVGRGQGAELQDDELFYSQMSDEIKEARFAAGVAQQFALAEAAMDLWSMDETDRPSTSWKGTQSHYLSYYLQDGGSVGLPQHLYDIHAGDQVGFTAEPPPQAVQPPPHPPRPDPPAFTAAAQTHAEGSETVERSGTLRPLECSSLSEDDVFYN
ncbi:hypothetical protein NHX12_009555 [Muraenolepis orangiensis]|uniref:Family with sequence similarity 131 member C n=1 Tax=Muraenolepis orangiensis TaxID=630683 RepID=A0A9Q0I9L8_9TELE|nr:hypothetical protein NHX12_009555 [Muraenolepis orangiensis]